MAASSSPTMRERPSNIADWIQAMVLPVLGKALSAATFVPIVLRNARHGTVPYVKATKILAFA